MAIGRLVVPEEKELIKPAEFGKVYPIPTPRNMAIKIQRVKYLSRKDNFFRGKPGVQLLAVIFFQLATATTRCAFRVSNLI